MPDFQQTHPGTTVDTCTHVLPAFFAKERQEIALSDATFHTLFPGTETKIAQAENLIESMDSAGIDVSVTAGFGWTDQDVARSSNDYNLETTHKYPDRIVAFCSVNPLWGQDAVKEVKRCFEAGAKGIGEIHPDTQGILNANVSSLAPVFDTATELGMPILIHASEPVGHDYPGKGQTTPDRLMALVYAFPKNRFIFSHFGGGLPFYGLMPEVKAALQNVYFDSAAFPFLYKPEVFKVAATAVGAEKILLASDYPLITQQRALSEFERSGLDLEQSRLIRGKNAERILQL